MFAATQTTTIDPHASGEPDPSGLAPAAIAPIAPLVAVPGREGMGVVTRVRGGMVRRGQMMRHLASDIGQGTVEYVGLLLLMATLLAAVVGGAKKLGGEEKIGQKVVDQIGNSIDKVEKK